MTGPAMWDIDFSSALRNRTGKYHVGRHLIDAAADSIHSVRYGRFRWATPPEGMALRLIELAGRFDRKAKAAGLTKGVRAPRPVVHLDPYTAVLYDVQARDLFLCHDMGPLTHPDLFAPPVVDLYKTAYDTIASAGAGLVFVSQASLDAHAALFPPGRVMKVIYQPIRASLSQIPHDPIPDLPERFLLTVGSIGARKNQAATIRAFAQSGLADEGWGYVLCGPREPRAEAVEAAAAETAGVTLLSFVGDGQLAWLYAQASGFVLLSQLEGFGVPVAEAMINRLVPLVSRDSVLEEVAGEGALTADPNDITDMAQALHRLVSLPEDDRARRADSFGPTLARFTPERFQADWLEVLD
jgi:glycosyltransferase involved in cell wall biosynthesis